MVFLPHILSFYSSIATAMQRKKAFIWTRAERMKITRGVILANEPAGVRAFSLQSKKIKQVLI
jgi:hypothetical protein